MDTIEDLKREVSRLQQDLSFARDDASQQAQKAAEFKNTLRDTFAVAALTGLVSAVRNAEDLNFFNGEGAKLVWEVADAVIKAR